MTCPEGVDLADVDCDTVNWTVAKAAGLKFAYLKKAQHVYPDKDYAAFSENARVAGVRVGAYFFPGWSPNAASVQAQVAALKNAPGDIVAHHDLPVAIDVEPGANTWQSTGSTAAGILKILDGVVKCVQDTFACAPVIYISYNQWYGLGCPSLKFLDGCSGWIKTAYPVPARQLLYTGTVSEPHYGETEGDPQSYYQVPGSLPWFIQQWQGDVLGVPGFRATVDVDYFNGFGLGARGPHVAWLQGRLGITVDSDFGPKTDAALRDFQAREGLEPGSLNVGTFASISW